MVDRGRLCGCKCEMRVVVRRSQSRFATKVRLSNLLDHRSASRDRCSTLEHVANWTLEPLVRYSDPAAVLVVDPSGVQWIGSWPAFFVFSTGCHVGSLLSSDHLSPGTPFRSRFTEKLVDGFHLVRSQRVAKVRTHSIMNEPSLPRCAFR